jgi:hypothetical protein
MDESKWAQQTRGYFHTLKRLPIQKTSFLDSLLEVSLEGALVELGTREDLHCFSSTDFTALAPHKMYAVLQ